jgi:hypothetical protein
MLLVLVWVAAILSYLLGPVAYHDEVRAETWLFVMACLLAFAAGAALGRWPRVPFDRDQIPEHYYRRVDTAVILLATIGVLGALALIVERLFFSGIDYSAGFTAAL